MTTYISAWARTEYRTAAQYQRWIASLHNGSHVLLQEFIPPSPAPGMPFEQWRFVKGQINPRPDGGYFFYSAEGGRRIKPDGKARHQDGSDFGIVFPERIVRTHQELAFPDGATATCGQAPIYEPLYVGMRRHTFFIPDTMEDGDDFANEIQEQCPHSYRRDVDRGRLVVCFAGEVLLVGARSPLFSEPTEG